MGARAGRDARTHPANRRALVTRLAARLHGANFDFVLAQRGMFSYSGLTQEQVGASAHGVRRIRRSTPAASAWPRSTRAISTTWPRPSPRSSDRVPRVGLKGAPGCAIIRQLPTAGIAQLVERNLAKVEVGSSRLLSRSRFLGRAEALPFRLCAVRMRMRIQKSARRGGRVVMQRPAKPSTPVRFRPPPPVSR